MSGTYQLTDLHNLLEGALPAAQHGAHLHGGEPFFRSASRH
jgi:hypothetical protein